jgi:hypothetical protein
MGQHEVEPARVVPEQVVTWAGWRLGGPTKLLGFAGGKLVEDGGVIAAPEVEARLCSAFGIPS